MKRKSSGKARRRLLLAASLSFLPALAVAQIATDGSVGPAAQALSGPRYLIPETLGRQGGSNLFHSFQRFNINTGESATFTTTTPGIANVISRVSGGDVSHINGELSLKPASGQPAFFFINPAGVVFGDGARLDLPGAFHVSTADYLGFDDGSRLYADAAKNSSFTSASPAAFGFLGDRRASVLLTPGADLEAYPGKTISLVAGDIVIDNAGAYVDGGDVRVAAIGAEALAVPLGGALPAARGTLNILDGGWLGAQTSVSNRSGSISVRAGEIYVDGLGNTTGTGFFGSALNGTGNAATIEIQAGTRLGLYDRAFVSALTRTGGAGGTITLISPQIEINDSIVNASSTSSGRAGTISLSGGEIVLFNGGRVWASADSTGPGGNIQLDASKLILVAGRNSRDAHSDIVVQTVGEAPAGSITLNSPSIIIRDDGLVSGYAMAGALAATAGHIRLQTVDLVLENGGKIGVEGFDGAGHGSVAVDASGSIRIRGKGEAPDIHPGADTVSTGILGHATDIRIVSPDISITESGAIRSESWWQDTPGSIAIATGRLSLQSGGHISGNALGHSGTPGVGAPISITAGEYVRVEGSSNGRDSSIASGTRSSGAAGSISLVTPWLRVADSGVINTSTGRFGASAAGRIVIDVDRLELIDGGRLAAIEFGHLASGGQITVTARDSIMLDGGNILAWSGNEAAAGQIRLSAPSIRLRAATITSQNDETALPGDIQISAGQLALSQGSEIQATSTSTQGAGDIRLIVSGDIRIDNSSVQTTADYAGGGNISMQTGGLLLMRNSLATTSVFGTVAGDGGDINVSSRGLVLDSAFIQANTVAQGESGGKIGINAQMLVPSGSTLFVGGQTPYSFQSGAENFNVIQAAAPTGVSGAINLATPALDLSGSVVALSAQILDRGRLGRNPCQTSEGSSLTQSGRGGLAPSGRDLLSLASPVISARPIDLSQVVAGISLAGSACGKE